MYETDEEWAEYFGKYEVLFDDGYYEFFDDLEEIKISNDVLALYIISIDKESKTCVYVINADITEEACPTGTWDIIYEQNYDVLENPEKGFDSYITNTEEYGWLCSAGEAILDDDGNVIALPTSQTKEVLESSIFFCLSNY